VADENKGTGVAAFRAESQASSSLIQKALFVRACRPAGCHALGTRAAARYAGRHGDPSDLSDSRWALVEPTLTAWRQRERRAGLGIGRPPMHDLRSILDAIVYVDRTGIPWRISPPPGRC
jgi:hypothetical protein